MKSAKYTEKQSIPRENNEIHCVYLRKQTKTTHYASFARIFCAFRSVFAEITLFGNDNGEFQHDFVAE